jgi:RNA polymerase sigma factor (sigma-70 family)
MSSSLNIDETELWGGVLRGEEAALDKIYRLHFKGLFAYGMHIIRNEDVVKDCIHDLFLRVWANRRNLSPVENIKSYLLSAVRNLLLNYQSRVLKFEHIETTDENHFDLEFNLESDYINKEHISLKAKNLAQAMNKLTSRQKEIIYLKYFEELSFNQIAEIMDLTVKGTYKLSARAMESLREIMQIEVGLMLALFFELKSRDVF